MADSRKLTEADFEPLDMDELKHLPDEFKSKYMLLEALFGDKSWEYIKVWCQKSADQQIGIMLQAPNWDQTVYARGKRDGFLEMLNMEKNVAFQFREIVREAVEQKLEAIRHEEEQDNE
jgi:hypothetical protein